MTLAMTAFGCGGPQHTLVGQGREIDEVRFEDDDGCLDPDNDGDGVPDTVDRAPGQAEVKNGYQDDDGAPDAAPAATTDLVVRIDPFEFVPGSTRPRADGDAIRCALELLGDFSETRFVLYGHTDDQGALERNLRLSARRAEAARALLVARGAAREQLDVLGVGSAEPLDPGTSEAARARNRRVEMRVAPAPLGAPSAGSDSALSR
ncbi:MAG: OmpA family protein [Bradymonadia bacterium]